jgi:hypothetical protein
MYARALTIIAATLFAAVAFAAPPLASSWNISPSGTASSSGELLFRLVPGSGESVEVTVPVRTGASDVNVARSIRQMLGSQLPRAYKIDLGEGANVLISDPRGKPSFSIELVSSDVGSLRVSVRNIEPAATPTVPAQSTPAITLPPSTPAQPGAATPPTQNPPEPVPPAVAPPMGAPPAGPSPPESAPGPTSPVTTAPGDSSQPSAPPPGGTPSQPGAASPPAAPPNATPPPK